MRKPSSNGVGCISSSVVNLSPFVRVSLHFRDIRFQEPPPDVSDGPPADPENRSRSHHPQEDQGQFNHHRCDPIQPLSQARQQLAYSNLKRFFYQAGQLTKSAERLRLRLPSTPAARNRN